MRGHSLISSKKCTVRSEKQGLLKSLEATCNQCKACELNNTRHNAVFADGNPKTASVVLIGEAPGENEDLQGIPFVGRAGKLLNEFLNEAGLSREIDFYIINTVKCRPPKNRVPTEIEKEACRLFLISQIEIIEPRIILLCGATALKSFYKGKSTISKIRGEIFDVEIKGKKYPAMPIFHPSYLLRNHSTAEDSPRYLMLKDLKKVYLKIKLLDR